MGVITIIANNFFENASGSIRDDGSSILTQSSKNVIQNGGKGENYDKNKDRKTPTDIRITKVEGPFDGKGKLVDNVVLGTSYSFKATPTRKPTVSEVALLKWSVKLDDGQKEIILGTASVNKLDGDKITISLKLKHGFEKAKVYAFYQKADDGMSVDLSLKKVVFPMLIGYSRGYDLKHHFMNKINKDVKAIALGLEDSTYGTGGQFTTDNLDNLSSLKESDLIKNMSELIQTGISIKNGLDKVGKEMVNHFIESKGGKFENEALNNVISKDSNFDSFKKAVTYKILIRLKKAKWNLSNIEESDLVRFDNVAFNQGINRKDGLTILIDAVEHIEVYIQELEKIDEEKYKLTLKFVLFDTFGLDFEDIKKFGKRNDSTSRYVLDWEEGNTSEKIYIQNNYGLGFSSWWILQHRFNRKPFITKATILQEGFFSKNIEYSSPRDKSKNTNNDKKYD